jgi:hypothetical protein
LLAKFEKKTSVLVFAIFKVSLNPIIMNKGLLVCVLLSSLFVSCEELSKKAEQKLNEVKNTKKSIDSIVDNTNSTIDTLSNNNLKIIE